MNDCLNLYTINNSVLNDAIDKIVVKLHGMNKKDESKMFLLTGVGANGGTTTVGINVAISLAEAGWKTVFVDADLRKDLNNALAETVKDTIVKVPNVKL